MLVECERKVQTEHIKKIRTLYDIPVTSFAHSTIKSTKSVIPCFDSVGDTRYGHDLIVSVYILKRYMNIALLGYQLF